ncbi:MAG: TRAP transporter substrate-binding protein DctP [Burkholderiaceae bacterium]
MGLKEKLVAAVFAAAWTACALAQQPPAPEPPVVLKFHTHVAESSMQWQMMLKPWMDRIETQSNGRLRFERFAAMGFGGEPDELYEQVSNGAVDVVWARTDLVKNQFNRIEVFELPFMMTTPSAVSRALWEYVETYAADEFKDVQLLGLSVQGEGVVHTRRKSIQGVDDFKGLRLQSTPRLMGVYAELLGSQVVDSTETDTAQALSEGAIDGLIDTWDSAGPLRAERFIQRHTVFGAKTGALFTRTFLLAMNPTRYDSLPDDLKAIVDANTGSELSAEFGTVEQEHASAQRNRLLGGTEPGALTVIDEEAAQAFRKASLKVDQVWLEELKELGYDGQTLLDGARTLIKQQTK